MRDSSDAEGSDATSELPPITAQGQTDPVKMSSGELPIEAGFPVQEIVI